MLMHRTAAAVETLHVQAMRSMHHKTLRFAFLFASHCDVTRRQ